MKIKTTELDKKFSTVIRSRANWRCERCLKTKENVKLECSHFHGRRKKSVRFDPENAACLCFSCHRFFTENPHAHYEWFKKHLGEKRFDDLTIRANTTFGCDYKIIEFWLNQELKEFAKWLTTKK